ncbi:MAG: hypothetical protein AAGI44_18500 [Pseudomonadota bacterium]
MISPITTREAGVADGGEEGPGEGDRTFGRRELFDTAGNAVGALHFVSHALAVNAESVPTELESTTFWAFEDGVIFGLGVIAYQNRLTTFEDTPGLGASASEVTWNILGGVGVFAGAAGTIKADARGHDLEIRIDVTCD